MTRLKREVAGLTRIKDSLQLTSSSLKAALRSFGRPLPAGLVAEDLNKVSAGAGHNATVKEEGSASIGGAGSTEDLQPGQQGYISVPPQRVVTDCAPDDSAFVGDRPVAWTKFFKQRKAPGFYVEVVPYPLISSPLASRTPLPEWTNEVCDNLLHLQHRPPVDRRWRRGVRVTHVLLGECSLLDWHPCGANKRVLADVVSEAAVCLCGSFGAPVLPPSPRQLKPSHRNLHGLWRLPKPLPAASFTRHGHLVCPERPAPLLISLSILISGAAWVAVSTSLLPPLVPASVLPHPPHSIPAISARPCDAFPSPVFLSSVPSSTLRALSPAALSSLCHYPLLTGAVSARFANRAGHALRVHHTLDSCVKD